MAAIDDPSLLLQDIIVRALKGAATGVGVRVYDEVPEDAVFPYITIGNTQVVGEGVEGLRGAEVYQTIDIWSRSTGKGELKTLGGHVIAALDDADLSRGPLSVNCCELEDVNYQNDPDGKTTHAVLTFHILTD